MLSTKSSLRIEISEGGYKYLTAMSEDGGSNCTVLDQFDPEVSDANHIYPVKIMTPQSHPEICNQYNYSKW
jgi:hypothetical protein